jgi:competence protein ComEA
MMTWRQRFLPWLTPTPFEAVGVSVLLLTALVATVLLWIQREPPTVLAPVVVAPVAGAPTATPTPQTQTVLTIHVSGAVASPGLARVPHGSRVHDAVSDRGGLTHEADVERINLARTLTDGEHVHIPRQGEALRPDDTAPTVAPSAATPLDLNRADVAALTQLPGVGQVKAEAIVAYRASNGPFTTTGELRNVTGIGEATYQRLAPLVTVG